MLDGPDYDQFRYDVAAQIIILTLEAILLDVQPPSREVDWPAGSTTFEVSNPTGEGMTWTAAVIAGNSWLSITSGDNGTDNGTISVAYDENLDNESSRTGTISVEAVAVAGSSTKDVTVVQARNFTCGDSGTVYHALDLNGDCYVDLSDIAIFISQWMWCTDPANSDCDQYWVADWWVDRDRECLQFPGLGAIATVGD